MSQLGIRNYSKFRKIPRSEPTKEVDCDGLQSKRPQVKTSPKIGQNVPMVKNVGQNVPKMIFYSIFYEILGIIWDF